MTLSRRRFLQSVSAATLGAPLILPSLSRGAISANDRITLGFIGVGVMGRGHLGKFLGNQNVQVVAICDVVKERREHGKEMVEKRYGEQKKTDFKGCQTYNDFRELLARADIDAVVIATPDHWHAIPCVQAAAAKKHIYCEKPLTHTIAEGRKIVEAAKKNGIIFQTGSQQRSEFGGHFRKAVELVRNGRIGKVQTIHIGVGASPVACDLPTQEKPEGADWEFWLGPAPQRGYNEVLCPKGIHNHFPAWRDYKEYAGGRLADMGAHHFDIAQWALDMDASGPVKIEPPASGKSGLKFTYANGVVMIHGYPERNPKFEGQHRDCIFEGTEGTIFVSRGGIKTLPESILKEPIAEKEAAFRVYPSTDHHKNWIECIQNKKDCICTAEIGHRSAAVCHLANIGYALRKPLQWDPSKERFDDAEANKLLYREPRGEWRL
jgi:predicted dehydrogenase